MTVVEKTADFVLGRLREWGVHRVYGYPGDGINGFLGAYGRAGGDPEFIQPRHEEHVIDRAFKTAPTRR